ncbi:methyltransferase family protein [Lunatibacter salilacus]|uniref:methyltransferase family protein n=1 Tax=Lunatibacter salilacus TaxID=2483804 RepID=UPI001F2D1A2B|nr:isoprenylcysteine carboxylmethyltransferase family protein [Lunatibacter salilacus]
MRFISSTMPYFYLFIGWMLFYASHSYLAALNIKRKIQGIMGNSYKWYRLIYSLVSILGVFALLFYSGTIPPHYLLNPTDVLQYIGYMLATFGTIISVKSMKGISLKRFIGLAPHDDLKQKDSLVIDGLYRWVRHPLYAGLVLIFLGYFFFLPTVASMVHLIALLVYLPFGIYFEEKKLITLHGPAYIDFQKSVPPIIPTKKP